jgi:hypothetical protein
MKPIHGLELTPEEARGVQKYREWVQKNRRAGHLRRYLTRIDEQFPGLDDEYRFELAETAFRSHMSKVRRDAHADLVKQAAQNGGE